MYLSTDLKDTLHGTMDLEIGGVGRAEGEPVPDVGQRLLVHSGVRHFQGILTIEKAGPGGIQPVLVERLKTKIILTRWYYFRLFLSFSFLSHFRLNLPPFF